MEAAKKGWGMKPFLSWIIACAIFFIGFTVIQGRTPGAVDVAGAPILIVLVLEGVVVTIWDEIAGTRKGEAKPQ